MRLRFALSKHAFEQKVQDIVGGKPSGSVPQRIGLYRVKRIHTLEENQIGFETGCSIIDPVGITYNPSNPPPLGRYRMRICRNWYAEEW